VDFQASYQFYQKIAEDALHALPMTEGLLSRSMAYSLLAGGKRLRPVLALAAADFAGCAEPAAIAVPVAGLELIHTYSLIHDDLPCMDDDALRRGKPSSHIVFGAAAALLTGDALLTLGLELLATPLPTVPPERQLAALRVVAQAAGPRGMVLGQVLDMENTQTDLAALTRLQKLKTGALLEASARLGAILGGADHEVTEMLARYAGFLGEAFQIKDDILDVEGETEVLGKPAGSDAQNAKLTFVSCLGLAGAERALLAKTEAAVAVLADAGDRAEFLRELALFVAGRRS
jgi:geranylgeranyl diphosphate synthase type II